MLICENFWLNKSSYWKFYLKNENQNW
jgi:hypothetical protein